MAEFSLPVSKVFITFFLFQTAIRNIGNFTHVIFRDIAGVSENIADKSDNILNSTEWWYITHDESSHKLSVFD